MVEKGRNENGMANIEADEDGEDNKSDKAGSLHFVPLNKLSDFYPIL